MTAFKVYKRPSKKMINLIAIFFDLSNVYYVLHQSILLSKSDTYTVRGVANLRFK